MQQLIKNFDFNGHGVRVITNEENQVFFVAKDVCDVLGYTKASSTVIQTHCKLEGVTKMVIPSDGGNQEQFIINEGNLYRLVLKSKKKEAEKFESWVCDEVLPAIRKTGKYDAIQPKVMSIEELIIAQAQSMIDAKKDIAEVKQEVLEVKSKLAQIEESRNLATQELLLAERSKESLPEETTRVKIRRLVNQYCNAKNADQRSVWYVVYDRLYYRYGISLRSIVKKNNENMLDVAERLGHLDKIFAICSNELV
jgi:prophage antirepressor-like protein